jgi:hypothetical protein
MPPFLTYDGHCAEVRNPRRQRRGCSSCSAGRRGPLARLLRTRKVRALTAVEREVIEGKICLSGGRAAIDLGLPRLVTPAGNERGVSVADHHRGAAASVNHVARPCRSRSGGLDKPVRLRSSSKVRQVDLPRRRSLSTGAFSPRAARLQTTIPDLQTECAARFL